MGLLLVSYFQIVGKEDFAVEASSFVCTCCCLLGIHLFPGSVGNHLDILVVDHPSLVADQIVTVHPSSFAAVGIQDFADTAYLVLVILAIVAFKVVMAYLGFLAVMGLLAAAT